MGRLPSRVSVSVEAAVMSVAGSVDNGSAVESCGSICAGGSGARQRQSRVLQSVEHLETAVVTDGSVDSGSAAASCVGVGGGGGAVRA